MYYILYLEALSGGPSWVFSIKSISIFKVSKNLNIQKIITWVIINIFNAFLSCSIK